jgi:hypothetical protein
MKRAALLVVSGLTVVGVGTVGTASVASAAKPKTPQVKVLSTEHGPVAGGTTVDIHGRNLGGVTGVSFGATPAVSFTPVSQGEVDAVAPAGTGTVDITVTTGVGTSAVVAADQFSYVTTPTIQRLSPGFGTTLGGNRVTITGAGFTGVDAVSFGANAAASFTVQSDNEILAVTPAGSAGTVDVTVTDPSLGTSPIDAADTFNYSLKTPVVTSVAPDVGPVGQTVTITGKRFTKVSAVDFGGTPATSYTVSNSKSITAVAPAGTGTVDVTVTNASGASGGGNVADQFTYTGV